MPAQNDHGSEMTAGGESPREPLIDRQLELDLLRQHIAGVAETGKGHAVLILGESGVGKSRLAAEAAAPARHRGMTVISVRCRGGCPYSRWPRSRRNSSATTPSSPT